jgi:DNA mismatch endonuclease (patch repair protein)
MKPAKKIPKTETSPERSAQMARVRGRDTKPEMRVRRALHAAGLRYRLHAKALPGKPDIVLPSRKVAVFVHGCFWHRHPDPDCKLARLPKTRLDFWIPKLEGNRARDERKKAEIEALGWTVVVVWECEIKDARLAELAEIIRKMPRDGE